MLPPDNTWASLVAQTGKNLPANAGNPGSIYGPGRLPGEWNGYSLQCSCLEKSMDRGAWRATVHAVAKSRTGLSDRHFLTYFDDIITTKGFLHRCPYPLPLFRPQTFCMHYALPGPPRTLWASTALGPDCHFLFTNLLKCYPHTLASFLSRGASGEKLKTSYLLSTAL